MLLIYTEKVSPRFTYITKHIFGRMLEMPFEIITDVEKFIMADGFKISYAKSRIGNEFFIKNFGLLFEKGIREIDIYIDFWDEVPYFFYSKNGCLPFDILSASFYLISRYEEYLPHIKTERGNFPATESLAYKHNFLELPIIDIWVTRMKKALKTHYPEIQFTKRKYTEISGIEVVSAYRYQYKGIVRNFGGMLIDLATLNMRSILDRILVLTGVRKDPFNNFEELIQFHKENNIESIFFFLLADYTLYDKNVSYNRRTFRELIKMVADYDIVSILGSYDTNTDIEKLKKERQRMIDIINRPVKRIRMNYNRLIIPKTYQNIAETELNEDYNMGYMHYPGFRAGTSIPFYFYDLTMELQLPILINPFCFHSSSLKFKKNRRDAMRTVRSLKAKIENVNGQFLTIFSNRKLGDPESNFNCREFYKEVYKDEKQTKKIISIMKKILFTLCLLLAFSLQAQQTVVIPRKFEFQKEANQYQLNELTKFLFEKYGFKTLWEDEIPKELANRRCELLFAKVTDDSNMFSTKLKVHLENCQGAEVYVSEEGKTREKDYKKAYHSALRDAFAEGETLTAFKNSYVNNQNENPIPSVAQKAQTKEKVKGETEVISETISPETPSSKIFAQKLKDGFYQLVDSTPKIVLKVYKTSIPNVFIAENEQTNGVFHKENGKFIYEYYQNGKLEKEVFDVELE